mgnify:FL=1
MKQKILILLFFSATNIFAQFDNVGTSVANFLKIGVGSRLEAMGGAGIATVNDPTSMYWNVAGLAHQELNEYTFAHNNWIADIEQTFLGVGIPISLGTLGFQVSYLSMGDMKVTTWEKPEGTGAKFSANDVVFGIAFATRMSDRFSVGIQGKAVMEQISQSSANGLAIDIGARYNTNWNGLTLALVIANFGTQMRLDGRDMRIKTDPYPTAGSNPADVIANLEAQNWSMPLYFQLGTTFEVYNNDKLKILSNLDYRDERDYKPLLLYGVEVNYDNYLFARFGLNQRYNLYEEKNISPSFGGGVILKIPDMNYSIKIDYSYSVLQNLLEAQRITISFQD